VPLSHGYYRSSSLDTSSANYAYILFFGSAGANPEAYSYRHYGYSVRPFKNAE